MKDFVHLHVHSQYSILDGQASISKMVDKAIADGMKGMALTDHGNILFLQTPWPPLVVVQSPSHVRFFMTPWTAAHQASLSLTLF